MAKYLNFFGTFCRFVLSASVSLATLIHNLKGSTSYWIKRHFPSMEHFAWQDGYGGFSVGVSNLEKTIQYISIQKQHHLTVTYEDELQMILKKHGIEEHPNFD